MDDWYGGWTNSSTTVLSHSDSGSTPSTAQLPKVYAVFAPTDPTKTVVSVTLPNYGTSFLPGTCGGAAAVHVLSIAPRPADAGWLGAWAAPADTATTPPGGAGLGNQTLRMIAHPTVTGDQVRIRLSNTDATSPTTFDHASIAAQSGTGAASTGTPTPLTFCLATGQAAGCGNAAVTIPAGADAYSDPVPTPATGGGNLVVSLHLPTAVTSAPVHATANNGSYLGAGNLTTNTDGAPFTTTLTSTYYLSGINVSNPDPTHGTVVVLGDQTAAAGSPGATYQPTWVDKLPAKLAAGNTPLPGSVVNASLSGSAPTGAWTLAAGSGTVAADSAGTHNGTLTSGVGWSAEHNGSATFNGANGVITTSGPVLDTSQSYTVSAWAKLASTSGSFSVLSEAGNTAAGLNLQYSATAKSWALTGPSTDSATPGATAEAHGTTAPAVNTWVHLVGVYDAPSGQMSLYVNGQLVASAQNFTPWHASGPLTIGGITLAGGTATNHFNGSISDVRVYQRTISGSDVGQLFNGAPPTGPKPGVNAPRTSNSLAKLDQIVKSEPNVRTVVVALGTNDILAGTSATTIEQNITTLMSITNSNGLKNTLRLPNGDAVHVVVTTIPSLGLAPTDPREVNRQQLNADILNRFHDFGADDVVDFDKSVRDSAVPSNIAGTYLTGTNLNDSYYSRIAQTLSDAVNDFPPDAQL